MFDTFENHPPTFMLSLQVLCVIIIVVYSICARVCITVKSKSMYTCCYKKEPSKLCDILPHDMLQPISRIFSFLLIFQISRKVPGHNFNKCQRDMWHCDIWTMRKKHHSMRAHIATWCLSMLWNIMVVIIVIVKWVLFLIKNTEKTKIKWEFSEVVWSGGSDSIKWYYD